MGSGEALYVYILGVISGTFGTIAALAILAGGS
jgi:hypothetical protein